MAATGPAGFPNAPQPNAPSATFPCPETRAALSTERMRSRTVSAQGEAAQPPLGRRSAAPRGMAAAYDEHHPDIPAGSVYEEVPLSDLEFCEDDDMYYYECPCGDMFELSEVCAPHLPSSGSPRAAVSLSLSARAPRA